MMADALFAGCLAGAAVLIALPGRPAARRLGNLDPKTGRACTGVVGIHRPAALLSRPGSIRLGAGLGGLTVAVLAGGWLGVLLGCATAVVLSRALQRLEPAAVRARRLRESADLPIAADLLAAVLRCGVPVDRAAATVAEALGGPLGERLARVARAVRLGATAEEAWTHLGPMGGADRLVRAAVRSHDSGAALAGALARVADDLRADAAVSAESAARRAGVLIVLPLGLCFLPAFILAGLVPVIVAVLGDVL